MCEALVVQYLAGSRPEERVLIAKCRDDSKRKEDEEDLDEPNSPKSLSSASMASSSISETKIGSPKNTNTHPINTVFVSRVPHNMTEESVANYFKKYGSIKSVSMPQRRKGHRNRGLAYVSFEDPSVVNIVLQEEHTLEGKSVLLQVSNPRGSTSTQYRKSEVIDVTDPGNSKRKEQEEDFHKTNRSKALSSASIGASSFDQAKISSPTKINTHLISETKIVSSTSNIVHPINTIFIGGIPHNITQVSVANYFKKYGSIKYVTIPKDSKAMHNRGYAFVAFDEPSLVKILLQEEHTLEGKSVRVKLQTPRGFSSTQFRKSQIVDVTDLDNSKSRQPNWSKALSSASMAPSSIDHTKTSSPSNTSIHSIDETKPVKVSGVPFAGARSREQVLSAKCTVDSNKKEQDEDLHQPNLPKPFPSASMASSSIDQTKISSAAIIGSNPRGSRSTQDRIDFKDSDDSKRKEQQEDLDETNSKELKNKSIVDGNSLKYKLEILEQNQSMVRDSIKAAQRMSAMLSNNYEDASNLLKDIESGIDSLPFEELN